MIKLPHSFPLSFSHNNDISIIWSYNNNNYYNIHSICACKVEQINVHKLHFNAIFFWTFKLSLIRYVYACTSMQGMCWLMLWILCGYVIVVGFGSANFSKFCADFDIIYDIKCQSPKICLQTWSLSIKSAFYPVSYHPKPPVSHSISISLPIHSTWMSSI